MAQQEYKADKTVELKDKESGFYDDETDFKIVRDQRVELGARVGRKTNQALISGALLVVQRTEGKSKRMKDE